MIIFCTICYAIQKENGEIYHGEGCPQKPISEENKAVKHDSEKNDLALLPIIGLEKVGAVMTFGKKKYAAHNWRGGISYSRLLSASLRHIFAYIRGESADPESGQSHLAHACCCILMILEFETVKPELDDRYTK